MNPRSACREWALRALYQMEVGDKPLEEALEEVLSVATLEIELADFTRDLVMGVHREQQETLDPLISRFTREWTLERMPVIDRNALRLAVFELLHYPETPVAVVANEAVELVKKYSTADSGKFVNGVLGAIAKQIESGEIPRASAE